MARYVRGKRQGNRVRALDFLKGGTTAVADWLHAADTSAVPGSPSWNDEDEI
jgi:hypothetical protein